MSEFREELRFEFPQLPTQLFDYYILRCARQMAQEGNLIRRRVNVHAQPGVTRYALQAPAGLDLVGILSIYHSDPCALHNGAVVRTFVPPAEHALRCSREHAWFDDQEGVLHVSGACGRAGTYCVTMSVAPKADACELPAEYKTDFFNTLMMGVRGCIMLISGRPWTNRTVGQGYYNEFLEQIQRMGVQVMTHKQRGAITMNFGRVM